MNKAVCARQRRARRHMWRTKIRTLMLLVPLTRLGSLGTSVGFHALRNPSSKETYQEECVRGRR